MSFEGDGNKAPLDRGGQVPHLDSTQSQKQPEQDGNGSLPLHRSPEPAPLILRDPDGTSVVMGPAGVRESVQIAANGLALKRIRK